MNWLSLDAFLTRIRPYREALALALDMVAVALAWQATYLFRLGFERWFEARPDYDHWVMLGIVALYGGLLKLFQVPRGCGASAVSARSSGWRRCASPRA